MALLPNPLKTDRILPRHSDTSQKRRSISLSPGYMAPTLSSLAQQSQHQPKGPAAHNMLFDANVTLKRQGTAFPHPKPAGSLDVSDSSSGQSVAKSGSRIPRLASKVSCDPKQTFKPLPSPPVAQVITKGPVRAKASLIDASENPTSNKLGYAWPVLSPEKVSDISGNVLNSSSANLCGRSKPPKVTLTIAPRSDIEEKRKAPTHESSHLLDVPVSTLPPSTEAELTSSLIHGISSNDFTEINGFENRKTIKRLDDINISALNVAGRRIAEDESCTKRDSPMNTSQVTPYSQQEETFTLCSFHTRESTSESECKEPLTPCHDSDPESIAVTIPPLKIRKKSPFLEARQNRNYHHYSLSTPPSSHKRDRSPHTNVFLQEWTGSPLSKRTNANHSKDSTLTIMKNSELDDAQTSGSGKSTFEQFLKETADLPFEAITSSNAYVNSSSVSRLQAEPHTQGLVVDDAPKGSDCGSRNEKHTRAVPSFKTIKKRLFLGKSHSRRGSESANDNAPQKTTNKNTSYSHEDTTSSSSNKSVSTTQRFKRFFKGRSQTTHIKLVKNTPKCLKAISISRPVSMLAMSLDMAEISTHPMTKIQSIVQTQNSPATSYSQDISTGSGFPRKANSNSSSLNHANGPCSSATEKSVTSLSDQRLIDLMNARQLVNQYLCSSDKGVSSMNEAVARKENLMPILQSLLENLEKVALSAEEAQRAAQHAESCYNQASEHFRDVIKIAKSGTDQSSLPSH